MHVTSKKYNDLKGHEMLNDINTIRKDPSYEVEFLDSGFDVKK